MKVVVFLGPPGAGKGTQAGLLAKRLSCEHVSTGAILRDEIAVGSELGKTVGPILTRGDLVSDELLFACLEAKLERTPKSQEFLLLDGVPRTLSQVSKLDESLSRKGQSVSRVIALTAPLEKLVERFAKRWTCNSCGDITSFGSPEEATVGLCAKCGARGEFFRRTDDEPQTVQRRREVYERETAPLINIYKSRGILREFDGLRPIEKVYVDLACELLS